MSQDSFGLPEKLGPCGDEGGGTPTGTVTAFQSGQTITVTINEVIFHPGHYRIALAVNDRSELPAEPPVTAGSTPCGSVPVQNPPVFPVLADGVFEHSAPFSGPQSIQITLPGNVTCTKCTLQIIEFMSDHGLNNPGGCFYHHCADLSIQSTVVDGGGSTGGSAGSGCSVPGGSAAVPGLLGLFVLAALARRRGKAG
jgi:MYXO-CTERM domain-containing protein